MIFNMPTEARETHAHIGPGDLHARYISINVLEDTAISIWYPVQVPQRLGILLPALVHTLYSPRGNHSLPYWCASQPHTPPQPIQSGRRYNKLKIRTINLLHA